MMATFLAIPEVAEAEDGFSEQAYLPFLPERGQPIMVTIPGRARRR